MLRRIGTRPRAFNDHLRRRTSGSRSILPCQMGLPDGQGAIWGRQGGIPEPFCDYPGPTGDSQKTVPVHLSAGDGSMFFRKAFRLFPGLTDVDCGCEIVRVFSNCRGSGLSGVP